MSLSSDLLSWYKLSGRELPWRNTRDPYAIWVSEIMLQQTRVDTVIPYYERFMARYPNVDMLAHAPLEEVLKLWEGLGYYSRARNLHRAARVVVEQFGGQIPSSDEELRQLPGIGQYTSAAIRAIAFQQDALALEGNLRRVLARLYDIHLDPRKPEGQKAIVLQGTSALPRGKASEYNQALMDLGALICKPRAPLCGNCPVKDHCLALRNGTQELLPLRSPRSPLPHRKAVAAVILENGSLMVVQRPEQGLLGGLWGFPAGYIVENETNQDAVRRVINEQYGLDVEVGSPLQLLSHTYTHFSTTVQPYLCRIKQASRKQASRKQASRQLRERGDIRWVKPGELSELPMGKVDRMLASELGNHIDDATRSASGDGQVMVGG